TGGFVGFGGIPTFSVFGFKFENRQSYFFIILIFVIVFLVLKQRIILSRTGRALIAIRENVMAANGMGIHVRSYKILVFAISAFFTGVAGALYAHMVGYISPDTFVHSQSVLLLTMLLFGGSGSFSGPIIGATVITVMTEMLQRFSQYQTLIYGVFILLVVLYMPGGLVKLGAELSSKFTAMVRKRGAASVKS
ncbi:MAG: branched-chain amino acid ABC transporter permease, partial [Acinetobacter sp.]